MLVIKKGNETEDETLYFIVREDQKGNQCCLYHPKTESYGTWCDEIQLLDFDVPVVAMRIGEQWNWMNFAGRLAADLLAQGKTDLFKEVMAIPAIQDFIFYSGFLHNVLQRGSEKFDALVNIIYALEEDKEVDQWAVREFFRVLPEMVSEELDKVLYRMLPTEENKKEYANDPDSVKDTTQRIIRYIATIVSNTRLWERLTQTNALDLKDARNAIDIYLKKTGKQALSKEDLNAVFKDDLVTDRLHKALL